MRIGHLSGITAVYFKTMYLVITSTYLWTVINNNEYLKHKPLKMRKFLTLLLAVTTLSFMSYGQNGSGKVSGKVIDGNTKTIEAATITLLKAKDSSVAKITAANKEGNFAFEN